MDSSHRGKIGAQYSLQWDDGPEESRSVLNSPEAQTEIDLAVRRRGYAEEVAAASTRLTVARLCRAIEAGKGSPTCRRDSLIGYAVVTARNEALRMARPEQRQRDLLRAIQEVGLGERNPEANPLDSAMHADEASVAMGTLMTLSWRHRDAIILHYLMGFTHAQAAQELGMQDAAQFGNWLHKHALPALRAALPKGTRNGIPAHLRIKAPSPPTRGQTPE